MTPMVSIGQRPGEHAEELLLARYGNQIAEIFTERNPCPRCGRQLSGITVTHSFLRGRANRSATELGIRALDGIFTPDPQSDPDPVPGRGYRIGRSTGASGYGELYIQPGAIQPGASTVYFFPDVGGKVFASSGVSLFVEFIHRLGRFRARHLDTPDSRLIPLFRALERRLVALDPAAFADDGNYWAVETDCWFG